jgi:hypothetical protein
MRISYLVLRLLFPSNSNQTLIYLPTSTQFSFLIPSYTWTHMSASSILLNTPVSTQSASHSISTLSLSHWWIRCHHLHPHASPPAHRSSLPTLSSRVCGEAPPACGRGTGRRRPPWQLHGGSMWCSSTCIDSASIRRRSVTATRCAWSGDVCGCAGVVVIGAWSA